VPGRLGLLLAACVLAPVQAGCSSGHAAPAPPTSFQVLDLEALRAHLRPAAGEQAVLVNVWATWCSPCVAEMPELVEIAKEHADDGVRVVAISIDLAMPTEIDTAEGVRAFAEERGFALPIIVLDGELDPFLEAYDLPGPVPYTWVVGADGATAATQLGRATHERFEAMLAAAGVGGS